MQAPFGGSLRASAALVNSQLLVAGARLRSGPAASWERDNTEHPDAIVERERDDAPGVHFVGGFLDSLAVDANVAGFDHRLRERPAFHQPD